MNNNIKKIKRYKNKKIQNKKKDGWEGMKKRSFTIKKTSFLNIPFDKQWNIKEDESYLYYLNTSFFILEKDFLNLEKTNLKEYKGDSKYWPDFSFINNKNENLSFEIKNITPEILKNCRHQYFEKLGIKTEKDFKKKFKSINIYDKDFKKCYLNSYEKQKKQYEKDYVNKKISKLLKKVTKKINLETGYSENKENIKNFKKYNKNYLGFVFTNFNLFDEKYFKEKLISINLKLFEIQKKLLNKYDGIILLVFNLKKTKNYENLIFIIKGEK
ncbi:MAG: hypothetical protein HPAVJP_0130 [Candidatus Hepatoplasma vulgare]|nr:MAG: hypothetical protein HPAVJP_0130 [Candidatus Hepatoplasma sp.]